MAIEPTRQLPDWIVDHMCKYVETNGKIWPAYDDYQAKTTREIPLVVLERA